MAIDTPRRFSYPLPEELFSYVMTRMIELARPIRDSDWVIDLGLTGAAGCLRFALWAEPGASKNLMGERWTYAQQHTDELIGRAPPMGRYSQLASAFAMAASAYSKAREVAFLRALWGRPVMGVGMTASVSTDRARRGDHTCRVSVRTERGFSYIDVGFEKLEDHGQDHAQRRLEEGLLCDLLTLCCIRATLGLETPALDPRWGLIGPQLKPDARGDLRLSLELSEPSPLHSLAAPQYQVLLPDDTLCPLDELDSEAYVLFPGSFNPLHHGHEGIAELARQQTGRDVLFQISSVHPKKGRIERADLSRRVDQFRFRWPVVLFEHEGLYSEKSDRVPGMPMLIGADVVYGIQDLRYYQQSKAMRRASFDKLSRNGVEFLVAGRQVEGHYETLRDIPIPDRFSHLFQPLGGSIHVSSSELRQKGEG